MPTMKTTETKAASKALALAGTNLEISIALGVKPNVVANWHHRGIPAQYATRVARMAGVKAESIRSRCRHCGAVLT